MLNNIPNTKKNSVGGVVIPKLPPGCAAGCIYRLLSLSYLLKIITKFKTNRNRKIL